MSASSSTGSAGKVVDGNEQTSWQSAGTLPNLFIGRPDLNIFLRRTASSPCANSSGANCKNTTDGNLNSSATFSVVNGIAWMELSPSQASALRSVSIKTSGTDTVFVWIFISSQDSVLAGFSIPANNFKVLRFQHVAAQLHKVKLVSRQNFALYELAALAGYPTEFVIVDLGSEKSIGTVITRHWAGSGNPVLSTAMYISSDNLNWQLAANLNPNALLAVTTSLSPAISGRYIKVQHTLVEVDYAKASVWEITAFDEHGKYGPMPAPVLQDITLGQMLGLNGIWGWGHNMFSNSIPAGEGPTKFKKVASHARNYHNLHWDVTDPDNIPNYDSMPYGLAIWWLDWDREYLAWNNAGLKVGATIQYNNNTVNQSKWNNPFQAAYNYAYAFARHFGPTHGNGLVDFFEAGNEPWDYPASFYNQVQSGMIQGAKHGDSALFVLPCALQSVNPGKETATGGNYMGARLLPQDAPYIDAINVHHYSYTQNTEGIRIAVHPESKESEMRGILSDIKFRDTNLPDKKIYVTEWGWDSDGAGEACAFGECVSEQEQALYAVRGALMLHRLGIDHASWYFYGNQSSGNLYSRCGLESTSHQSKKSFYALQALLRHLGAKHFITAEKEDAEAWVYVFGDQAGLATHLVAWKPIEEEDTIQTWTTMPSMIADSAWTISGDSEYGEFAPARIVNAANSLSCLISATPLIIKLSHGIPDCFGVVNGTAVVDSCGVCGGDNISCQDCAGVINGTAFVDDCGKCSGGTTRFIPNVDKDCYGDCFGTAFMDECGYCVGGNTGNTTQHFTFYIDSDNDGYGNRWVTTRACSAPQGYVTDSTDCNDGNSAIHPSAVEVCGNNADENCDGVALSLPAIPASINGPSSVCKGASGIVFSVVPVAGATYYNWTSSNTNAVIVSGQGTVSISASFSSNFTSTTLRVRAQNACGTSNQRSRAVSSLPSPARPGTISGPGSVCAYQNNITYSVAAVSGAVSYDWTFPAGAVIASGRGTRSVTVNWGVQGGQISVVSVNANQCVSTPRTKSIAVNTCKTSIELMNRVPEALLLHAYPNPFSDILHFEFVLEQDAFVQLMLFNANGQILEQIVNEWIPASQTQRVSSNALSVPAGVIFYRFQTDHITQYGKVIKMTASD